MKQELVAQVLTEKDLSASTIASMPSEQRAATEKEIGSEVDKLLQAFMERMAQGAADKGVNEGALLNIKA